MSSIMQIEILDGDTSEESFKDIILDDGSNGSDSQCYSSNLNTNVVQKLFPYNYSSIIDNTKKNNEDAFSNVIQGEIGELNDLNLNEPHSQDVIEVVNSDYFHENKSSKVQCSKCNKFFMKKYIKEHMRRHRGEGTYNCDECKKYFQYPNELKRHYLTNDHNRPATTHSNNPYSKIQCIYCNKFFSKNYIRMHEKEHRGETTKKCDVCEKVFRFASELKRHSKVHKNQINDTKELNGDISNSIIQGEMSEMNDLVMDKRQKGTNQDVTETDYLHDSKILYSQCSYSYCKKIVRRGYIDEHMRRHRGEGTHKCDECENYYYTTSELKKHYLRHEKEHWRETHLKCELCVQFFKYPSQLEKHKQMHSDNLYKCDKCEDCFSRNDLLEEHVKYSHVKQSIQRVSVIQKVVGGKKYNPVLPSIHNKSKSKQETEKDTISKDKFKAIVIEKEQNEKEFFNLHRIQYTDAYNTVGLLMSANFLSREEIREHNTDEVDLGNLDLDKLLKLKKFLADTPYDKIDKTEETINGDKVHKIVRANVVDQHLVLTNMDMNNFIKMENFMMEKSQESYKDMTLEDDYYFILDTDVANEIRVLISILILKNAFVCSYVGCLTTCRQRATMATHYMTHLGIKIKQFKCDRSFCEKHFSKLSALEQHKKNHINGSVLNQFKCISCEETFRHRSTLQKHIIIHQELITSSSLFGKGNEVEDTTTSSSIFRQGNEMEEPTMSSSNSIFRWRNEMEDHIYDSEEENEVEASPKKIELVCSHQNCHLVFSSQWKFNMHKMSNH